MAATVHLKNGIEAVINGNWQQAEFFFLQAIEVEPNLPEAHYQLGLVCKATNRLDEAATAFYNATKLKPNWAEAYFQLGLTLKNSNRLDGAEFCIRQAIELKPDFAEAYNNLGLIFSDSDRLNKAYICFHQSIELRTDYVEAYNNLGVVQAKRKLPDEAVNAFCHALELQPDNPYIHNNLGLAFKELNRLNEAKNSFQQALNLNPDYAEACLNLGLIYKETDYLEEAEKYITRAIELKPDFPLAYNNLAAILTITNRFGEAESYLRQSIKLKPDSPETHRRLGLLLKRMNRLDCAEAAYLRAIELSPPDQASEPHLGLGFLYLLRGQFTKGWEKYELRRKVFKFSEPAIPYWQGENLSGCKILLFFEQGLGDTIQFIRYAPKVAELASETVVKVQGPMKRLFTHSLSGCKIIAGSNIPAEHYDFACSLHSLPYIFNTGQDAIYQLPYIRADKNVSKKWQIKLHKADGGNLYRIGVVWAGNPKHDNDRNRSIPFTIFNQLFNIDQISWISLQVGSRAKDIAQITSKVFDFSRKLTDFAETAGLIQNLDLVITVDSSVAHLAGAMGKKTWILLPFAPDWRWQLDREDSPWYSSVQLFRQHKPGNWQDVLEEVRSAIRELPAQKSR